jgi:hypothetical protein
MHEKSIVSGLSISTGFAPFHLNGKFLPHCSHPANENALRCTNARKAKAVLWRQVNGPMAVLGRVLSDQSEHTSSPPIG